MTLRKDKVAAALQAMKGICSDPENPTALPEVMGQLADILGNVFDDIALPELPQLDSGEFGFPNDAPFDFPLGGGGIRGLDPLDGLESRGPGVGEEFGPGGDGGGGDGALGGGPDGPCVETTTRHVTLLGKAEEDIPAAKDGNPGVGTVRGQIVEVGDIVQLTECQKKCDEDFGKDIRELDKEIEQRIEMLNSEDNFAAHIGINQSDEIKDRKKQRAEIVKEFRKCMEQCRQQDNEKKVENESVAGTNVADSELIFEVKNISCEKIEKDTQVVISGLVTEPFNCGDDDLYVMVESCGCCEDDD